MLKFGMYKNIEAEYKDAKEIYAAFGVDTDEVLKNMQKVPLSLHCWQGDDVVGLEEGAGALSGGGILATGNYPGRARNGEEIREDIEKAMSLIPGKQRVNLHAIYAETDGKHVDRDELRPEYFKKWIQWAKENGIGLDFNPTFFSHKMVESGYTLSSKDDRVQRFWIEHGKRCREIAAEIGKELKSTCINNTWIPDGSKDLPADRMTHRRILKESLDEMYKTKFNREYMIDSVESKLFGIGSESYVVGSHEFYLEYVMRNKDIMLCLDSGHFHPTENIFDKISSVLAFSPELLLHLSRGVRWDSDHVTILNDDVLAIANEVKRCNAYDRVHFALDFFDASINRISAWVIGARAVLKSILISLLEPTELLLEEEEKGKLGNRLALMEEFKSLPYAAVWNKYCYDNNTPAGHEWLKDVQEYEDNVLSKRA